MTSFLYYYINRNTFVIMVLVQKILNILNNINDLETVMYDSGFSANVRIDRKPLPAALFYLLNDWTLDATMTTVKESANIQVFFFDTCNFDAKGEEKDVIVQRMEDIAKEFIADVFADKSIVITDDKIRIQSSYGKFDKFCVGVSVQFRIEEKQASCL